MHKKYNKWAHNFKKSADLCELADNYCDLLLSYRKKI